MKNIETIPPDFSRRMLALGANQNADNFLMVRSEGPALADAQKTPFDLGAKRSWVPILGEIVWEIPKEDEQKAYYAYICKISDDRQIGYVRIPDYNYAEQAVGVFDRLIARFQNTTAALVLDQVNNAGGSMYQMYALLSKLTDKPLALPQHQITIGEDEAAVAADVIANADEELPERVTYSRFVLSEREAGRGTGERVSHPVYLEGVEQILPADNPYTGRIVVLINELTFSAGEFLAAILQDNRRATLFGARTAGAGGCARRFTHRGVLTYDYTLTWTIARRTNGDPIEDTGVQPDVAYETTLEDLRSTDPFRRATDRYRISGFQSYRRALLQTLTTITSEHASGGLNGKAPNEKGFGNQLAVEIKIWRPSEAQLKDILEQQQALRDSKGAKGKIANLSGADLRGAELAGVVLPSASLRGANLSGVDLRNALLGWANLGGTTLRDADLRSADLKGAYLSHANLNGANLSGANLKGANLSDADLSDADLTKAELLDAYLPGVNLSGADLRGATGLVADQLRSAVIAPEKPPKLPKDFESPLL